MLWNYCSFALSHRKNNRILKGGGVRYVCAYSVKWVIIGSDNILVHVTVPVLNYFQLDIQKQISKNKILYARISLQCVQTAGLVLGAGVQGSTFI